MLIHSCRSALAMLLLLTGAASTQASVGQSGEPVAIIEDYSGDASHYRVIRGDVELGVKALMELRPGDEVLLDAEQGELSLVYYDGARVEIKPGSKSHRVAESHSEKTIVGNLLRWATSLLGDWRTKDDATQPTSLISRGKIEPLDLPLLPEEGSLLQAGTRDLHLAWIGGKAPYDLTVTRIQQTPRIVASLTRLLDPQAVVPALRLKKGRYELAIVDARGKSLSRRFEARNDLDAPQLPAAALNAQSSKAYDATLSALFLAAAGDSRFVFESYQRLSNHAANYEPAEIARRSLARGIRPTSPE